jgi:integrase/recombinase XerD
MAFSIRFELNNKETSDFRYLIMLRLTKDRKITRIKTDHLVKKTSYNPKAQFGKWIRTNEPRHAIVNSGLKSIHDELFDFITKELQKGDQSPRALIEKFKGRNQHHNESWLSYAKRQIDYYHSVGKERYAIKMRVMVKKLESYLNDRDLSLSDSDLELIQGFDSYLREIGNAPNTVDVNLKIFKLIYRKAIDEGIVENPNLHFLKYSVKTTSVERDKLNVAELEAIENLNLNDGDLIWHIRNYFLFALYMGGIRFGDFVELCWSNIKDDNSRLDYLMNKTGKHQQMRIPDKAKIILGSYKPINKSPNSFIFPLLPKNYLEQPKDKRIKISNSKNVLVNKYLKQVAKKAGIEKNISFHVARHSFAYIAYSKTKDPLAVQHALQHSKLKETQEYITSLANDSERDILGEIFN